MKLNRADTPMCPGCAVERFFLTPQEIQLALNYVSHESEDGMRVFTYLAPENVRGWKNADEREELRRKAREAESIREKWSVEDQAEFEEMKASGIIKTFDQIAEEEKEKQRRGNKGAVFSEAVSYDELKAKGIIFQCRCGMREVVKL